MKTAVLTAVALFVAGCAAKDLGQIYDASQHARLTDGASVAIVYVDADVADGIGYQVWANGHAQGLIYPNTFRRIGPVQGVVKVGFREQYVGKVIGGEVPESFTLLGSPLSFRPPFVLPVDVGQNQVHFIRVRKEFNEEFFACEESADTTTLCGERNYKTVIEEVDVATATPALVGMRESL